MFTAYASTSKSIKSEGEEIKSLFPAAAASTELAIVVDAKKNEDWLSNKSFTTNTP